MSKKEKPAFQGPMTQDQSLEKFTPQGFYAPTGNVTWGNDGYKATISDQYNPLNVLPQYDDMRLRLLGDIGLTGQARADQLDQYGNAFMDKSLEYSAPRLKAMTYGRGQAGSRMAADSYSDLVNKASTDAILSREQLRNLDEQLKLQQLTAVEGGIGNAYNQYGNMIQQLLSGGQISQQAAKQAMDQARAYVSDYNTLESERVKRANSSNNAGTIGSLAGTALAIGAAPFTGGGSLAFMPQAAALGGSIGGMFDPATMSNGGGQNNVIQATQLMKSFPSFAPWQPGQAVPGYGGYGASTPSGVYNTGRFSMLPKTALGRG